MALFFDEDQLESADLAASGDDLVAFSQRLPVRRERERTAYGDVGPADIHFTDDHHGVPVPMRCALHIAAHPLIANFLSVGRVAANHLLCALRAGLFIGQDQRWLLVFDLPLKRIRERGSAEVAL